MRPMYVPFEISFRLLNGCTFSAPLPRRDDLDVADKLDAIANQLSSEFAARRVSRSSVKSELTIGHWVVPPAQDLIEHCIRENIWHFLLSRSHKHKKYCDRDSLVHRLLAGIFASTKKFTSRDVERFGNRIYYAGRHYVPSIFTNGFIAQITDFESKSSYETIESGFGPWIAFFMAFDGDMESPYGEYPKKIGDMARIHGEGIATILSRIGGLG